MLQSIVKADDDSLSKIIGPLLALLQPLLNGLNQGLQVGSIKIGNGAHQIGSALSSTVSGVGTIIVNTAAGAGGTVKALPCGLYKTTKNLQQNTGIIGNTLNTLTGASSSSSQYRAERSGSHDSYGSFQNIYKRNYNRLCSIFYLTKFLHLYKKPINLDCV